MPTKEKEDVQKDNGLVQTNTVWVAGQLPWGDNEWFRKNDEEMAKHVERYSEASSGRYKTQKELHDAERKEAEEWNKKINRK